MKIALVYPDAVDVSGKYHVNTLSKYQTMAPLGIMYLAAILEQEGHKAKIYDNALYEHSTQELVELILKDQPDAVCFSTTFKNIQNARAAAKKLKSKRKGLPIIFGGPQVSYFPEEEIKHGFIDIIILGEAEHLLPEIIAQGLKDRSGIVGPAEPVQDLDSLPYPAWHLWDIETYKKKWPNIPVFSMVTSRGCPYHCTFCSLPDHCRKYRTRDPVKVVDELEFLVKRYNARTVAFMEDNFALNRDRVSRICDEIIKRDLKVRWTCDTRVNNVTFDLLKKMKAAGLQTVLFGVESGSQKTLDWLKKGITLDQVRATFAWCQQLGIKTFASFMIGIPGETKADIFNTFDFMCSIKPAQTSFQTYVAIPGSELYDYVKQKKLYSAVWETALIVSTKELPRSEAAKMEKELTLRTKLYQLFRRLGLDLSKNDHELHYDKKHYKRLIDELTQAGTDLKEGPEKSLNILKKIALKLSKIRRPDRLSNRVVIYCHLLSGLIYSAMGNRPAARSEADQALAIDRTVRVPYSL